MWEINSSAQPVLKWGSLRELLWVFRYVIRAGVSRGYFCHGLVLLSRPLLYAHCVFHLSAHCPLEKTNLREPPVDLKLPREWGVFTGIFQLQVLLMHSLLNAQVISQWIRDYKDDVRSTCNARSLLLSAAVTILVSALEEFVRRAVMVCNDWGSLECGHMGQNLFKFTVGKHTSGLKSCL